MKHVLKIEYETAPCSRCGGSGTYSYCPGYGNRCFKCGGAGTQLSRRGKAALKRRDAWVAENVDMTAATVQVGDKIDMIEVFAGGPLGTTVSSRWVRVVAVEHGGGEPSRMTMADGRMYVSGESVRRKLRPEELDALGARLDGIVGCTVHYKEEVEG